MTAGEIFDDLDDAYQMAKQEQEYLQKFIDSVNEYTRKIITEIYGEELLTMESKGFTEIDNVVISHICTMAREVNNIVSRNQY